MLLIEAQILVTLLVAQTDYSAYWSFDDIENNIVIEHNLGLNAEVHGAPQLTQGALNGAIYLDGIDDFASVYSMNAVNKTIGTFSEGSISGWFRFDDNPGFMDIETIFYLGVENEYSSYGTASNAFQLEIGHFSAQRRLYWTLISTDEEHTDIPYCWATTNHLDVGRWYHILCTVSEDAGTNVYLNNQRIFDSEDLTWNFGDDSMCEFLSEVIQKEVLWFGKGLWDGTQQFYRGAIDEIQIWNYALSEDEVEQEYERVASVGSLSISPKISDELVVDDVVELYGNYHNIVRLLWSIDDGDSTASVNSSLNPSWSIEIDQSEIPAGRHEIKVVGLNAANRAFSDFLTVIQPDLNSDQLVDINDILQLLGQWGACGCPEDLNGNGEVEVNDSLIVIAAWS